MKFSLNKQQNWLRILFSLQAFCGHHVPFRRIHGQWLSAVSVEQNFGSLVMSCRRAQPTKKYVFFNKCGLVTINSSLYAHIRTCNMCTNPTKVHGMQRCQKKNHTTPFPTQERTKKASEKSPKVSPMFSEIRDETILRSLDASVAKRRPATRATTEGGFGGFLKWWYLTTMGFPTKNDHFGGVLGVPPFKETPIWGLTC